MSKIKIINEERVYDGSFLQVSQIHYEGTKGKAAIWEKVTRKHGEANVVAIVPITDDGLVILNKIYRIPVGAYIIEQVAGLMDVENESEEEAIRRELLEETGYVVSKIEKLAEGPWESALGRNIMSIYLGLGAKKIAESKPDNGEDIEVLEIPIAELRNFLHSPPPECKVDLKLFAIVHFLERRGYKIK